MRDFQNTHPLLPHRLDADTVARLRACTSDACRQRCSDCPSPQSCALPEGDDRPVGSARGLVAYFVVTPLALASAAIHFWPQIVAFFLEIL